MTMRIGLFSSTLYPAPGGRNVVSGIVRYFAYQLLCGKIAAIRQLGNKFRGAGQGGFVELEG